MFFRSKSFSAWLFIGLATIPIAIAFFLLLRQYVLSSLFPASATKTELNLPDKTVASPSGQMNQPPVQSPLLYYLNYEEWLTLLKKEAEVAAARKPSHLTILAGDSLSRWFPSELLPPTRTWLNQAIVGDTSGGLLRRLKLFNQTQPEIIFIMIGINDIFQGATDEKILGNQRQIILYLRRVHPNSQIIWQSILPIGSTRLNRAGQKPLPNQSNRRIQQLNQRLQAIAIEAGIYFHDIYPLFADKQGNLRPELTTDGIHLNKEGYLIWRSTLRS